MRTLPLELFYEQQSLVHESSYEDGSSRVYCNDRSLFTLSELVIDLSV